MDKRTKELNDGIVRLRQAYDQCEKTAELLLEQAKIGLGSDMAYLRVLGEVASDKGEELAMRVAFCMAQLGVLCLLLNEAEREHADMLLGIDPNDGSDILGSSFVS